MAMALAILSVAGNFALLGGIPIPNEGVIAHDVSRVSGSLANVYGLLHGMHALVTGGPVEK